MLAALGLGLCVGLLVVPVSSRDIVFADMRTEITWLRKCVQLQKMYMRALEREVMFVVASRNETSAGTPGGQQETSRLRRADPQREIFSTKRGSETGQFPVTKEATAAKELRDAVEQMIEMAGKIGTDLKFSERDVAWAKLTNQDVEEAVGLLRAVVIPTYVFL